MTSSRLGEGLTGRIDHIGRERNRLGLECAVAPLEALIGKTEAHAGAPFVAPARAALPVVRLKDEAGTLGA